MKFSSIQVLDEIEEQGITIYELPDCESDEDEEYVEQTKQLKVMNLDKFSIICRAVWHPLCKVRFHG